MKTGIKILRNTFIYSLLVAGFLFLYLADIDTLLHPDEEIQPQSKVEFIYQQF